MHLDPIRLEVSAKLDRKQRSALGQFMTPPVWRISWQACFCLPKKGKPQGQAPFLYANPFPWMAEMIDLKKEKNFFETRVTEYQTGGALSWD
jgi:hypothetical protein